MASIAPLNTPLSTISVNHSAPTVRLNPSLCSCNGGRSPVLGSKLSSSHNYKYDKAKKRGSLTVVSAFGDVSSDGNNYLIAGAIAIALVGTAFPILFSRKDLCPVCDGAGFVRKSEGGALRANAARKDQAQIVCANCKGLGKLNQVDKS